MYPLGSPPLWLVLLLVGLLAVPSSAVFALLAIKLWERFVEPR